MNGYITYAYYAKHDRFKIFNVETNRQNAMAHFRTVDLSAFLSRDTDPDAVLFLEKVIISVQEYQLLREAASEKVGVTTGQAYKVLTAFCKEIEEDDREVVETIYVANHFLDARIMATEYCLNNRMDPRMEKEKQEAIKTIFNDEQLLQEAITKHISKFFPIRHIHKNFYVTYDRYEYDEWFSIYHIDTNMDRAMQHFDEKDLPSFLAYGPDDCHAFQLEKVTMTLSDYRKLLYMSKYDNDNPVFDDMMYFIYHGIYEKETLRFTNGMSDMCDIND